MNREKVMALLDNSTDETVKQLASEWLDLCAGLEVAQTVIGHTTLYARRIGDKELLETLRMYLLGINKVLAEINPDGV